MNILDDEPLPKITTKELTPENLDKLNKINEIKSESQSVRHQNKVTEDNGFKKKKKNPKPLWAQTQ